MKMIAEKNKNVILSIAMEKTIGRKNTLFNKSCEEKVRISRKKTQIIQDCFTVD